MHIEDYKNFSQSALWKIQKNSYQKFGISAWSEKGVPFFLTSHPWTAECYRQVVAGFLYDCKSKEKAYIFDLGAGTGQFAYHFLKEPLPFQTQYIVTDIVQENLNFILNHQLLRKFSIQTLNFAVPFQNKDLKLGKSPIILIANYFFDTIPQELYRIEKGTVYQGEVALSSDREFSDPEDPQLIPHLELNYRFLKKVPSNPILDSFLQTFDTLTFLYPVYAMQILDYFASLTEGPLLLLASDQAMVTKEQHLAEQKTVLDLHSTFSLPVSYLALSKFVDRAWFPFHPDAEFTTMAATYRGKGPFTNLENAFNATLRWLDPWHHWQAIQKGEKDLRSLKDFLLLLRLSFFDPTLILTHFESIRKWIANADIEEREELADALMKVAMNFYPIGKDDGDFLINLAVLAVDLKREQKALQLLDQAALFTTHHSLIQQNLRAILNLRVQGYFIS